jgi:hypothetical protein
MEPHGERSYYWNEQGIGSHFRSRSQTTTEYLASTNISCAAALLGARQAMGKQESGWSIGRVMRRTAIASIGTPEAEA